MNSIEYLKSHKFGYGLDSKFGAVNRLMLRNIDDLKIYIQDVLENAFFEDLRKQVERNIFLQEV